MRRGFLDRINKISIMNFERSLGFAGEIGTLEFQDQSILVNGFKKSWAQGAMNGHGGTNDFLSQFRNVWGCLQSC